MVDFLKHIRRVRMGGGSRIQLILEMQLSTALGLFLGYWLFNWAGVNNDGPETPFVMFALWLVANKFFMSPLDRGPNGNRLPVLVIAPQGLS